MAALNLDWVGFLVWAIFGVVALLIIFGVLLFIPYTRRNLFPMFLAETENPKLLGRYIAEREYPPVFERLRQLLGAEIANIPVKNAAREVTVLRENDVLTVLADFVQFFLWGLKLENRTLSLREPTLYWRHRSTWLNSLKNRQSVASNDRRGIVLSDGKVVLWRKLNEELFSFELSPVVLLLLGLKDSLQLVAGAVDREEWLGTLKTTDFIKNETQGTAISWFQKCFH